MFCGFLLISCVAKQQPCKENPEFKNVYFEKIDIIDKRMSRKNSVTNEEFKKALLFISKYTSVDFESMANYAKTYPIGVYETDRIGWIKWYEENKCNNIQFR